MKHLCSEIVSFRDITPYHCNIAFFNLTARFEWYSFYNKDSVIHIQAEFAHYNKLPPGERQQNIRIDGFDKNHLASSQTIWGE